VLLPLLHRGLEEFAVDDAVERLANRPGDDPPAELMAMGKSRAEEALRQRARERWEQKTRFAALRIARLGWSGACHFSALEILGFRRNRAPMLRIAGRHPLSEWAGGAIDPRAAWLEESPAWQRQGLRPANFPLVRLRQYERWSRLRPDWPSALMEHGARLVRVDAGQLTACVRQAHGFPRLRSELSSAVVADSVAGSRFDNLVCDGLLPLIAASGADLDSPFGMWYHWRPGDAPPVVARWLRRLEICGPGRPLAHGLVQALMSAVI
jgi:hypothetical protein